MNGPVISRFRFIGLLALLAIAFFVLASRLAPNLGHDKTETVIEQTSPKPATLVHAVNTTPTIDLSVSITDPVQFKRDDTGYSLYANSGVVYYGEQTNGRWEPWVGPERLLMTWLSVPFDGERVHEGYMLNLASGAVEHLPGYTVHMNLYARKDGEKAVFLDLNNDNDKHRILLSDLRTGEVQTVYDIDRTQPQWAGDEIRPIGEDMSFTYGEAVWVGQDAFFVNIDPGLRPTDKSEKPDWSETLLLADTVNRRTYLLRGSVLGSLPDGTVFISRDTSVGEELDKLSPPYTNPPEILSEPGQWISSFAVSPDGLTVAWLTTKPPGKGGEQSPLSNQHQACFEGCGFRATPISIGIWQLSTGKVSSIDLEQLGLQISGQELSGQPITWARDNTSVFYASGGGTLYKFAIGGTDITLLHASDWVGRLPADMDVLAERDDGALYLYAYYGDGVAGDPAYYLLKPGVQPEALDTYNSGSNKWVFESQGHLIALQDTRLVITNMSSGNVQEVTVPRSTALTTAFVAYRTVRISPDGKWLIYSGEDDNQFFSFEGLEHKLVLKVVRLK